MHARNRSHVYHSQRGAEVMQDIKARRNAAAQLASFSLYKPVMKNLHQTTFKSPNEQERTKFNSTTKRLEARTLFASPIRGGQHLLPSLMNL